MHLFQATRSPFPPARSTLTPVPRMMVVDRTLAVEAVVVLTQLDPEMTVMLSMARSRSNPLVRVRLAAEVVAAVEEAHVVAAAKTAEVEKTAEVAMVTVEVVANTAMVARTAEMAVRVAETVVKAAEADVAVDVAAVKAIVVAVAVVKEPLSMTLAPTTHSVTTRV